MAVTTMPHAQILSLLRAGALEQAEKEYFRLNLNTNTSNEDIMALGGRILKTRALEKHGVAREKLALQAAKKYEEAYQKTGGTFSGVNTAALYLVSGNKDKAQAIALDVLRALKSSTPAPGSPAYYHIATVAEAELIVGNRALAEQALADAILLDPHNYEVHASTLHQFEMIIEAQGQENDWLTKFRPPKTIHYAGHMFGNVDGQNILDDPAVFALEKAVDNLLEADKFGAAYGALAAGSDILIAERLLAHGIDLHIVQPCPDSLFEKLSLAPFGSGWLKRFKHCKSNAASVRYISKDASLADELTCAFASETAKGLAILHANQFATEAVQLLIWDGRPSNHSGGTAKDAILWQQSGRPQLIVPYSFKRARAQNGAPWHKSNRSLKAMLFADVANFGGLSELQIPLFIRHVLTPLAAAYQNKHQALSHINTWGDGLFLVFDTVQAAANAAIALQLSFQNIDLRQTGLPENLALRVGGHYGPTHTLQDPFLHKDGIFGREVTVAARIEPNTAPGSIYISEPFACALAASKLQHFRCEPISGTVETKDQGGLTLFSLRKINPNDEGG